MDTLHLIHSHGKTLGQARLARLTGDRALSAFNQEQAVFLRRALAFHLALRRGGTTAANRAGTA